MDSGQTGICGRAALVPRINLYFPEGDPSGAKLVYCATDITVYDIKRPRSILNDCPFTGIIALEIHFISSAGALADLPLGLAVYHIFEDEIRNVIPEDIYREQIGLMELSLDSNGIRDVMKEARSKYMKQ